MPMMRITNSKRVLPQVFFNRPAPVVAKELLGKFLVRRIGHREIAAMITETEAYEGPRDKASHASRGMTARNAVMFGPPGVWYVYFTYGMHWMLNVVTGKKGYPAAVLLRGIDGANGPARLTKLLGINRDLNGKPAVKASGLWIEDGGVVIPKKHILSGPRVGVAYAGRYWAGRKYRFYLVKTILSHDRKIG